MVNYESQKRHIKIITKAIMINADGINYRIQKRYGIPGGYTESEIKQIAIQLVNINRKLQHIRSIKL